MQVVVALCVATGGSLRLGTIQRHVRDCTCRQKRPKYRVECYDCDLTTPPAQTSDSVIKRASECAQKALAIAPYAAIGIGLERGTMILCSGGVSVISPAAAAVLVYRNKQIRPKVILITPRDNKDVSQTLLRICKEEGFHQHRGGCLMNEAVKKIAV